MSSRKNSRRLDRPAKLRAFRPRLEALEDRTVMSLLGLTNTLEIKAVLAFDSTSGTLSLLGGAGGTQARIAMTDNGAVAVTVNGQFHSSDAGATSFDAALAGLDATTLRAITVGGGNSADSLTLDHVAAAGDLTIYSDGSLIVNGDVHAAGGLYLAAASLFDVEAGGSLAARAIAATGDEFVNNGQIRADGAVGGSIVLNARDYLNGGTVSAAGSAGVGGGVYVGFTQSYIDTASARTSVSGVGGAGGEVTVSGLNLGRLFSSGRFDATGTAGGWIDLFGQSIGLDAATLNASGSAGHGGRIRVGGDLHGMDPSVPNAATVEVNNSTSLNADAGLDGAGGQVIVWSRAGTNFYGNVETRGAGGGAGGFIEVSSLGQMNYGGQGNAGTGGTLLLDPGILVVAAAPAGVFPQYILSNPGTGGTFGAQVLTLGNGNVVVTDPTVNNSRGAVYLFNGTTGALLSTLTGSTNNDLVGQTGVVALTGNNNFVVLSVNWNGNRGAATWVNGATGLTAAVAAANSLVGSTGGANGDFVGISVTALTNGNYVVGSSAWDGAMGAATWGSGTAGVQGVVSNTNSLVGSTGGDSVGTFVTALSNGNYVVGSPNWTNPNGGNPIANVGAATWGSGTTGVNGAVSAVNSLVGTTANDRVGNSITALIGNGNYVVASPNWTNGAAGNAGAATWGHGTTGVAGAVTNLNSLVGTLAFDGVGNVITALSNGNYVVGSPGWTDPNGGNPIAGVGAATRIDGTTGGVGDVTAANSLHGSTAGDQMGSIITALTNGNYVVGSPNWTNPSGGNPVANAGAATWMPAAGGAGVVDATNSLVGDVANDQIGSLITALSNGNYVVASPTWTNPNGGNPIANAGIAVWNDGSTGGAGVVTAAIGLVGAAANDGVGSNVIALRGNGNFVVLASPTSSTRGSATWSGGLVGTRVTGTVSAANSLVGAAVGDQVGSGGVTALSNGNYVVSSPTFSGNRGAATWGNGATGTSGTVSATNSLIGSAAGDNVGASITALVNGNYVVNSPNFNSSRGAATWGNGSSGATLDGTLTINTQNSILGASANSNSRAAVPGPLAGSFLAAFPAEGGGRVSVGFTDPTLFNIANLGGSQTITVTPAFLLASLNAGTNVTLQATISISINADVTPTGTGVLTLNAPTVNLAAVGTGTRFLFLTPTAGKISGTLTQSGKAMNIINASNVNATGAAGDTAYFNDQAGTNLFIGTSTYSAMSGGTGASAYVEAAFGYGTVYGVKATNTNNDSAYLFSPTVTNDNFYGTPTFSYLQSTSFTSFVGGSFNAVYSYGNTTGTHNAYLFASANAGDNFFGTRTLSYVQTASGQIIGGVNSSSVFAYANASVAQAAFLFDGATNDTFNANPFYSILSYGTGSYLNDAISFRNVVFYSFNGGTDSAILNDSTGSDSFNGSNNTGTVLLGSPSGQTKSYVVQGFTSKSNVITLNSTQGGTDTSTVSNILYTLTKTGNWM